MGQGPHPPQALVSPSEPSLAKSTHRSYWSTSELCGETEASGTCASPETEELGWMWVNWGFPKNRRVGAQLAPPKHLAGFS